MDGREFIEAVKAGDLERVRLGLQLDRELAGARDEDGLSPVLLALYHGRSEVVHLLAGDGTALDLHEAAALGVSARVRALLVEDPHAVNSYSADGWTALHLAAFFGHADAVDILVDAGADTEARAHNRQDNTPLHAATAGLKNTAVIRLLARGADVNARNGQGLTPLHLAAHAGDIGLMDLFVRKGARLDVAGKDGETPMSLASGQGQGEAVSWLRDRGAKR